MVDLQKLIDEAMAKFDALSLEQQAHHRRRQRESCVRAEMSWPKPRYHWENGVKVYESYEDYCNG
jgi:hypothetical protein